MLSKYVSGFEEFNKNRKRISELKNQLQARDLEISKLENLVNDYEKVKPRAGELSELENEITKLGSVEALNTGISQVLSNISGEDSAIISLLYSDKKTLEALAGKDSNLDKIIERFADISYELSETNLDLERYLANLEADPHRFDLLQARKSELNSFIKKYGRGEDRESDLINECKSAELRLGDLRGGDVRLAEMEAENEVVFKELQRSAKNLSGSRIKYAAKLGDAITKELAHLAMPNSKIEIAVTTGNEEEISSFGIDGIDEIMFTFTSHKDGKLLPLNKSASGGELSRVMLAIEVVLAANSPIGTYIFDEVDSGVGGKAAIEVGKRLALLSQNSQVLVVTHLAQVASWADSHLVVAKNESGSVTQSNISLVGGEDRKREIARLLSGQEDSATAQQHAGELLDLVAAARKEMIG
jgi:DNA repair protein RecN (Recombination protein N)